MSNVLKMLSRGGAAAAETDPNFNQTVLLLHGDGTNGAQNNTFLDSSTNNFTITRNGNTTQGTFSPFSVPDGYWSNYFSGSTTYLVTGNDVLLQPGTSAFTLEAWIYRNVAGAAHPIYSKGSSTTGIELLVTSGNVLQFAFDSGSTISSTGTIPAGTWTHVAVVREGTGTNQTKLYINGVQDGVGTVATNFTASQTSKVGANRAVNAYFAGYISNLRFVKGTAVYTGNFTPSITPLTAITNTNYLVCQSNRFRDASANNFIVSLNGTIVVSAFSPFAPTAAYDPAVNGGSGYFDGTGDYLSVPDDASWAFGSGDFTIEGWLYRTKAGALQFIVSQTNNASASGSAFLIDVNSSNNFDIGLYSGSTAYDLAGGAAPLNEWVHFAVVRSSTRVSFFVNGVRTATNTAISTNSINDAALPLIVGARSTAADAFGGYIGSFRIIKGAGPYDAASTTLTVPTAPLTAISNTVLLTNFTNAGIFDQTGKNNLETVGNAQVDTNIKKYGTGSMKFDGSGDYLTILNLDGFQFGTGNFTVEFWLYANSSSTTHGLIAASLTGSGYWASLIFSGLIYWQSPNGATNLLSASYSGYYDTWTHVAFVRNSGTTKLYLDGIEKASASDATNYNGASGFYDIGRDQDNSAFLTGYIDDLRITKGVARYTANFTPPTKEFPDL